MENRKWQIATQLDYSHNPHLFAKAVVTLEQQDSKGHHELCVQIREELLCSKRISVFCVVTTGRIRTSGRKFRGR